MRDTHIHITRNRLFSFITPKNCVKKCKHFYTQKIQHFCWIFTAGGRTWTGTVLPPRDFKSLASAYSATPADGWRWIRTTEGVASRFTVCPLWPLGNPPIHCLSVPAMLSLTMWNCITYSNKLQVFFSKKARLTAQNILPRQPIPGRLPHNLYKKPNV